MRNDLFFWDRPRSAARLNHLLSRYRTARLCVLEFCDPPFLLPSCAPAPLVSLAIPYFFAAPLCLAITVPPLAGLKEPNPLRIAPSKSLMHFPVNCVVGPRAHVAARVARLVWRNKLPDPVYLKKGMQRKACAQSRVETAVSVFFTDIERPRRSLSFPTPCHVHSGSLSPSPL